MAEDRIPLGGRHTDGSTTVVESEPVVRSHVDTHVYEAPTVRSERFLGRDHVHWGPVFAGLVCAITVMAILGLLGLGIGLTGMNAATAAAQGSVPADAGRNSAIWAGIASIIAFLIGGYVAARTAGVFNRNWGAMNGAVVFMVAVPIALWLAGQGMGAIMGSFGNLASGLNLDPNAAANTAQNAAAQAQANPTAVGDAAAAIRNAAWGSLVAVILGLIAATLGGWLGARQYFPMTHTTHTMGYEEHH